MKWLDNKSKSLGEILLAQRALAVDEFQIVEALVAKYLQRHPCKNSETTLKDHKMTADFSSPTIGHTTDQAQLGDAYATRAPIFDELTTKDGRDRVLRSQAGEALASFTSRMTPS